LLFYFGAGVTELLGFWAAVTSKVAGVYF